MGKGKKTAQVAPDPWRNRIVGHDEKPAEWFVANPLNHRIHPKNQQAALGGSLGSVGWIDEVTVNVNTGVVVDGHLRVIMALRQGDKTPVPVRLVDLTEEEERVVLASKDTIGAMAAEDGEQLAQLLASIESDDYGLRELFSELAEEADGLELSEVGESNERALGDAKKQIKPVLYAEDVATFERALMATGEANRARALMTVCEFYLEQFGDAEG